MGDQNSEDSKKVETDIDPLIKAEVADTPDEDPRSGEGDESDS